jgi:hypothetical protein
VGPARRGATCRSAARGRRRPVCIPRNGGRRARRERGAVAAPPIARAGTGRGQALPGGAHVLQDCCKPQVSSLRRGMPGCNQPGRAAVMPPFGCEQGAPSARTTGKEGLLKRRPSKPRSPPSSARARPTAAAGPYPSACAVRRARMLSKAHSIGDFDRPTSAKSPGRSGKGIDPAPACGTPQLGPGNDRALRLRLFLRGPDRSWLREGTSHRGGATIVRPAFLQPKPDYRQTSSSQLFSKTAGCTLRAADELVQGRARGTGSSGPRQVRRVVMDL